MHIVMRSDVLSLRRLVIAEVRRFPELGQLYFERSVQRTVRTLASLLEHLGNRGLLDVEHPATAAAHFNWLVLSVPFNRSMLCGDAEPFSPEELDGFAERCVEAFLRAYGCTVTPDGPKT